MSRRIELADYTHLIIACLLHDIGYVRGVLSGDTADEFVVDDDGAPISLPGGVGCIAHALPRSTIEAVCHRTTWQFSPELTSSESPGQSDRPLPAFA